MAGLNDDMEEKKDEVTVEQPSAVTPPPEPQYTNAWDEIIAADEERLKRQKAEDQERIKNLSAGRQYWIGANMLANALGNAINVFGTTNGAPAMKMPDMDTSYLKTWKETDDMRRANYQRMKDQYDRLRLGKLQRDQQIADKRAELQYKKDMEEKAIQDKIGGLKANYGNKYQLTDAQWRAWAKDGIVPDVVKRGQEADAFNTKVEQQKELNRVNKGFKDAEEREKERKSIARIKAQFPPEWNVTDEEAASIAIDKVYPLRIQKRAADEGYTLKTNGRGRNTVSYGVGANGKQNNDIVIKGNDDYDDFVIKGLSKDEAAANRGKIASVIKKSIENKFKKPTYKQNYSGDDPNTYGDYGKYSEANAMYASVVADLTNLAKGASMEKLNRIIDEYDLLEDSYFVDELRKLTGNELPEVSYSEEENKSEIVY